MVHASIAAVTISPKRRRRRVVEVVYTLVTALVVRRLLLETSAKAEAVWRLLRWEPGWHGFARWGAIIRDSGGGSVRKKKAVIACVRLLFIDLWRLFTQRATLTELGFRGAPAGSEEAGECHP